MNQTLESGLPGRGREAGDYQHPDAPEPRPGLLADGSGRIPPVWYADSVRVHRGRLALATLGFAIGALIILLNSPWRNQFLAPGPLASSHAQILRDLGGNRCGACHLAGDRPVSEWFRSSRLAAGATAECQSDLCLRCHDRLPGREHPLHPHNLDPALLRQRTEAVTSALAGTTGRIPAALVGHPQGMETGCGTCHREHHGSAADLTAMTDAQCQSCHVRKFRGFDAGHPDFSIGIPGDPPAVRFDHASHASQHFATRGRPFDCEACHPGDATGQHRLTAGYEPACADCHDASLRSSQGQGLELIAIPMLDIGAIRRAGISVVDWPTAASGAFDGRLPPLMQLLLAADQSLAPDLGRLGTPFDCGDLDDSRTEDLAFAARLAGAIARLAADLATGGGSAAERRLAALAGGAVPVTLPEEVKRWLDNESLRSALAGWFPASSGAQARLSDESHPAVQPTESQAGANPGKRLAESGAGLVIQRQTAPADEGLLAENPVRHLRKQAAGTTSLEPSAAAQPSHPASLDQPRPAGQSAPQVRESGDSSSPRLTDDSNPTGIAQPASGGELLAVNPLAETRRRVPPVAVETPLSSPPPETGLAENLANRRPPHDAPPRLTEYQSAPSPAASPFFPEPSRDTDASTPVLRFAPAAWQIDSPRMVIRWGADGHADPWTIAWLQWLNNRQGAAALPEPMQRFRDTMASAAGPGQCASCHAFPAFGEMQRGRVTGLPETGWPVVATGTIVWRRPHRDPAVRDFTRFNHSPHLLVAGCESCHPVRGMAVTGEHDPPFRQAGHSRPVRIADVGDVATGDGCCTSGLLPVGRAHCASCHREGGSPDRCTTCHNYHLTVPARPGTGRPAEHSGGTVAAGETGRELQR